MSRMSEIDALVNAICEDRGYDSPKEFDFEDIDYLAAELQIGIDELCNILRIDSISI